MNRRPLARVVENVPEVQIGPAVRLGDRVVDLGVDLPQPLHIIAAMPLVVHQVVQLRKPELLIAAGLVTSAVIH